MAGTKGKYVIVRPSQNGASVFSGNLVSIEGDVVTLQNARRIWYWTGAATLSQLAVDGTSKPGDCKFPVEVRQVLVNGWSEIIDTSPKGEKSIKAVPVWEK